MKDMTRIINRIMESKKTYPQVLKESKVSDELIDLTHRALIDLDHGDEESKVVKKYAPDYKKLGVSEDQVRKMFQSYKYDEPSEAKAQDLVMSLTEAQGDTVRTSVEPQTTVGQDPVPVLSQCHACMGVYRGEPQKCPICGAPADRSVKLKESINHRYTRKKTEARKAMTADEFGDWHEDPVNYRGKDAQMKMDKIYSILDRAKTTSDSVYDQYQDLPEKDKEEITRLIYNESQGEDIKVDADPEFTDELAECDQATSLLECGDYERFNEKYGSSTSLSKDGKLQIIIESSKGRRKVVERDLNSTQKAAFKLAESARSMGRSEVTDPKALARVKKARINAIIHNESKAARVAATRYLESQRISYDFKKLREAVDHSIDDRIKDIDNRINEIMDSTGSTDTVSLISEIIKDTGLNVVAQDTSNDGDTTFITVRVQDEPEVEVNLQDVTNTISDALGTDVSIVGPNRVAGDSVLIEFIVVINPKDVDIEESDSVALSESLYKKLAKAKIKESQNPKSSEQKPPKLSERKRRTEDLMHGDGEKVEVKETSESPAVDTPTSQEAIDKSNILVESIDDIENMDEDELIKIEEAIKKTRAARK